MFRIYFVSLIVFLFMTGFYFLYYRKLRPLKRKMDREETLNESNEARMDREAKQSISKGRKHEQK